MSGGFIAVIPARYGSTRLPGKPLAEIAGVRVNGHPERRLAGNLNVTFEHVRADDLMQSMQTVALSSGSSCASADAAPSHVLRSLGVDDESARCSIRIGVGRFNTEHEIETVADTIGATVESLRAKSPLHRMARTGNSGAPEPKPTPTAS